jgi:hypothetical protein
MDSESASNSAFFITILRIFQNIFVWLYYHVLLTLKPSEEETAKITEIFFINFEFCSPIRPGTTPNIQSRCRRKYTLMVMLGGLEQLFD